TSFSFSNQEKALIDYSNQIVIPMIMKHKGVEKIFSPLNTKSIELQNYINLFLERFNGSFKNSNQKLIVEIHLTDQLVGLFFKLISLKQQKEFINYVDTNNAKV